MNITEQIATELIKSDDQTKYENFCMVCIENGLEEDLNTVRFGVELHFDFEDYLADLIIPKLKSRHVIIDRKIINFRDFNTELMQRRAIMNKTILESVTTVDPLVGR